MADDYDNIDVQILDTIDTMRAEYHACTARRVAQLIRVSPDVVRYRMEKLRRDGLVEWNDVPGSIRRVEVEKPKPPAKKAPASRRKTKSPVGADGHEQGDT